MAGRTFTTEDGITFPWKGPVNYYCKNEREPSIRSRVYVDYFNMNEKEDRERLASIMTQIRNNVYQAIQNPLYTTGQDGNTRVSLIYEFQFACDPSHEAEPAVEVEMDPGKEEPQEKTEQKSTEEPEEEEPDKTPPGFPVDSLNSQPIPEQFKDDTINTEEDQKHEG